MRSRSKVYSYYKTEYRSKFELNTAKFLRKHKVKFSYESTSYTYKGKVLKGVCDKCGNNKIHTLRSYTPDFFLFNDVIIETKGLFTAENRKTMVAVREQHPDIDLRIVFMRNNKIHRKSKMRYMDWAENNGFICAVGEIPQDWFTKEKDVDQYIKS
jgi:hypothetical protein